jgi:hypothetical protein
VTDRNAIVPSTVYAPCRVVVDRLSVRDVSLVQVARLRLTLQPMPSGCYPTCCPVALGIDFASARRWT